MCMAERTIHQAPALYCRSALLACQKQSSNKTNFNKLSVLETVLENIWIYKILHTAALKIVNSKGKKSHIQAQETNMHKTGQSNSKQLAGMGKHPLPIQFYKTAALRSLTRTGNGRRCHLEGKGREGGRFRLLNIKASYSKDKPTWTSHNKVKANSGS